MSAVVEIDVEAQLDRAAHLLHTAPTKADREAAWEQMKRLHEMRSPQQVERMEIERGLR